MSWDCQIFNNRITGKPFASQPHLIVYFRIIDLKIIREFYFRIRNQFQVSCAGNNQFNSNRIISFQFLVIDGRRNCKLSYSTGEVGRLAGRKWIDIYRNLRGSNIFLNLYDATSSIKKCIERIGRLYRLSYCHLELSRVYIQFSRLLREKHKLTINRCIIVTSLIMFRSPLCISCHFNFLRMETFKIRKFGIVQLQLSFSGIDFICQDKCLLFEHIGLTGSCSDK